MRALTISAILGSLCLLVIWLAAWFYLALERKKGRPPLSFQLLRGPGESLRRKISALDENLPIWGGLTTLSPLFVTAIIFPLLVKCFDTNHLGLLISTGLIFFGTLLVGTALLIRKFAKRQRLLLGYLGERLVGETLDQLRSDNYRIFHDVPVQGKKRPFNLDHVVIGPTGLFVIETKTRRKGRPRAGYKDHEVIFDGRQLIWPWGEDTYGLQQAINEAEWLTQWLREMTGLAVQARPILTLPGWFVTAKTRSCVTVLNQKNLCSAILGRGEKVLTNEQVDLLARQLDARCRDISD